MEQRHWKKAGITTSLLGYGCMRLPTLPDGRIDEVRAEALAVRFAGKSPADLPQSIRAAGCGHH